MDATKEDVERILLECIGELYARDFCLLENDVSERAITHKLAEYLQQRIQYLNVDCEYNRNAIAGKQMPKILSIQREEAFGIVRA